MSDLPPEPDDDSTDWPEAVEETEAEPDPERDYRGGKHFAGTHVDPYQPDAS